jgi:hypothetical protein
MEIGGTESRRMPRPLLAALIVGLALLALAGIVWLVRDDPVEIGLPPEQIPLVRDGSIALACPEFKISERQVTLTLDFPPDDYDGSWFALETEGRVVVRYNDEDHAALVLRVTPIRMPRESPLQRLVLSIWLDKNQEPPAKGGSVTVHLAIPGVFFRRAADLDLVVEGVERVSR